VSRAVRAWNWKGSSYPSLGVVVHEFEEVRGVGGPAGGRAGPGAGRRLLRGQGRRLLARVDRLDFHAAIEFITRIILSGADQVFPRPNPSGNCPLLEGWLVPF